jgi:hypothetical protein
MEKTYDFNLISEVNPNNKIVIVYNLLKLPNILRKNKKITDLEMEFPYEEANFFCN